jgi:hypothetical protein
VYTESQVQTIYNIREGSCFRHIFGYTLLFFQKLIFNETKLAPLFCYKLSGPQKLSKYKIYEVFLKQQISISTIWAVNRPAYANLMS